MPTVWEIVLNTLPVVAFVAFLYWALRLYASERRGERRKVKWRELGPAKRVVGVLMGAYLGFNLYLSLSSLEALPGTYVLPFRGRESLVLVWATILALALLFSYLQWVAYPRRPTRQAKLASAEAHSADHGAGRRAGLPSHPLTGQQTGANTVLEAHRARVARRDFIP